MSADHLALAVWQPTSILHVLYALWLYHCRLVALLLLIISGSFACAIIGALVVARYGGSSFGLRYLDAALAWYRFNFACRREFAFLDSVATCTTSLLDSSRYHGEQFLMLRSRLALIGATAAPHALTLVA